MRKLSLLVFIFFFNIIYACARPKLYDSAHVYIGTSHGVVGSGVFFIPNVEQELMFGYNGGIMMSYESEKKRALQIEINFSQRGWKEEEFARKLNYIEMPFIGQFYFGNQSGFIINLGAKFSFLASEKILYNNYVLKEREINPPEQHSNKIQNKFDYGAIAGVGYKLFLNKQVFMLEVRGNFNFGTIYKNNSMSYFVNSNNVNVALNLGWMIRVK